MGSMTEMPRVLSASASGYIQVHPKMTCVPGYRVCKFNVASATVSTVVTAQLCISAIAVMGPFSR